MKKTILSALLCAAGMSAMAQVPAGVPQMGAFGFGGNQASDTEAEWSKKFTDINYVGDGEEYHNLDIYLPKTEAERYPVVVHIYGSA